jgi:hypothetical protein
LSLPVLLAHFIHQRNCLNISFLFFSFDPNKVEVPGCEAYREYLFNYLRDQPIWHTLRFWNAALFYALQKDKVPKAIVESSLKCSSSVQLKNLEEGKDALTNKEPLKQQSRSISESSLSSSSSSDKTKSSDNSKNNPSSKKASRSKSSTNASGGVVGDDNTFDVEEQKIQENMAFSHLG